ncbi:MAG: tyrosine-type recombinase/integrase [Anaerolineales bacterium]|nr:tyrosine-type recombinase/integrase [Anaerolineales bacterium]
MNFHPSIDHWLAELERQGKSQATIAGYRRALAHFVRWSEQTYGQAFDPAAIIPRDVADWKTRQQTVENAAPATINTRLTALSQYFAWAVAEDMARSDPTVSISGLPLPARRPKALDEVYVRRLLRQVNQAGEPRDVAIVELLLGTGLRVSELLALRVSDLTLGERSGEVVVRRGKGGVHRWVPLTAPVRRALRAYLDSQPKLKRGDPCGSASRPAARPERHLQSAEKYAHLAGLDPDEISPHVLRHTMATRYLAANPDDLRGLAAILGHADLNTVMDLHRADHSRPGRPDGKS